MKNINLPQKITAFDYFIIVFFLLLSGLTYVVIKQRQDKGTTFVMITQNNKLVYKAPIEKEHDVKLVNAIVEIKGGKVRIKESTCPFKICIHTGWISRPYQQIICVPNKICVNIVSEIQDHRAIDSVTY